MPKKRPQARCCYGSACLDSQPMSPLKPKGCSVSGQTDVRGIKSPAGDIARSSRTTAAAATRERAAVSHIRLSGCVFACKNVPNLLPHLGSTPRDSLQSALLLPRLVSWLSLGNSSPRSLWCAEAKQKAKQVLFVPPPAATNGRVENRLPS